MTETGPSLITRPASYPSGEQHCNSPRETIVPTHRFQHTGHADTTNQSLNPQCLHPNCDFANQPLGITALPTACLHLVAQSAGPPSRLICKAFLEAFGPFYQGLRPITVPTTYHLDTTLSSSPSLHSVLKLDLSGSYSRVRDPTLALVAQHCTRLQYLDLTGCFRVTDYGLVSLSPRAHTLHTLILQGLSHNGSVTLPSLQFLTSLRTLITPEYHSLCSDRSHLDSLLHLTHLTHLEITPSPHLADACNTGEYIWQKLSPLPSLSHLSVPLSKSHLSKLSLLTQLSHLELRCSSDPTSPEGTLMPSISNLTNLTFLKVNSTLTAPDAPLLSRLTNLFSLERLSLSLDHPGTHIAHLACLPSLTHLTLSLIDQHSLHLTSLAPLSGQLQHLILPNPSRISSFSHISSLSNLKTLHALEWPDVHHHQQWRQWNAEWELLPRFFPLLQDISIRWYSQVPRFPYTLTQLTALTSIHLPHRAYQGHLSDAANQKEAAATELVQICQHLTNLQHLTWPSLLFNCQDEHLSMLSNLNQLTALDLGGCEMMEGSCLQFLPASLRRLHLHNCFLLTGESFQHLAGLANLTFLDISGCPGVCDETFKWLRCLERLQCLNLSRCDGFEGWGLRELIELSELVELVMDDCLGLKDEGLLSMGGLPTGLQRFQFAHAPGKRQVRMETVFAVRELCPDVLM